MRRSKSNPARYAKGYRKISQRRMTDHIDNEEEEIQRLRELLKTSTEHLSKHCDGFGSNEKEKGNCTDSGRSSSGGDQNDDIVKKSSNRSQKKNGNGQDNDMEVEEDTDDEDDTPQYITDDTAMILPSRKRKSGPKTPVIILTPEEIKSAKNKHKAMQRKLQQIESRHAKKKRRTELYEKLSEHAVTETEMKLMGKSSELGKKLSKKEMLSKILRKERAGLVLTEEEKNLLYIERDEVPESDYELVMSTIDSTNNAIDGEVVPIEFPSSGRKRKKSKKTANDRESNVAENNQEKNGGGLQSINANDQSETTSAEIGKGEEQKSETTANDNEGLSFAERMMAGLSSLKTKATIEKMDNDQKIAKEEEKRLELIRKEEEDAKKKRPVYVPKDPLVVKCPAVMGMTPKDIGKKNWRILSVNRPEEINQSRYGLPVSSMEFEIIDSIRNNSVTILCSETGSGKSTQVPQFLYESGSTLGNAANKGEDNELLICVTQPRRVAAISTAKRVCYEMGHSRDKGQSIRNSGKRGEGNLVAYQTKYESAGVGSKTRIIFKTDGILLQEIKSDLLLRKYSVIVLDEAHERNLNTDVLLGLLSVALPLRRKAAMEGSLPPLKLIIMSATLRVEDFTGSGKLFCNDPPNLVKVPGRTFPVTIHHNKTTELDDYEGAALQKVCKIHRKLPPGGILVFLTGKQEIIRMVNRLRRRLVPKNKRSIGHQLSDSMDIVINEVDDSGNTDSILRDMDDEEADGDLYQKGSDDDLVDENEDEDDLDEVVIDDEREDNIPKKVIILPLYSLLSVKEQARVFEPIDEDTRLIVVSTNIAETSLTIPGVSYVVDSGRQKCRNYHAGTGIASYDVMWISKAAADQRAGRAGRTGPGHCYRIYSSSVYDRQLDSFALPEVLTRPLEDIVLAMKAMGISNISEFPFPTAPDTSQLQAAMRLLDNIGCLDTSKIEINGGDGDITPIGTAIAKLPIGVRYGKMLLVAAQAGVLDYGILMVSVLSESSPFTNGASEHLNDDDNDAEYDSLDDLDDVDRNLAKKQEELEKKARRRHRWSCKGGDLIAAVYASFAFLWAGKGAGGYTENLACKRFCEENGLNFVVMERIKKMSIHLARLAQQRLGKAEGSAAQLGKIIPKRPKNNKERNLHERYLSQAISSGLLDNVARISTQGRLGNNGTNFPRTAYISCRSAIGEPLFIDKKSVIFSRDHRQLPEWICYDSIIRKTTKKGDTISMMTNCTPVNSEWLGAIANGSKLVSLGEPTAIPTPKYDKERDEIMCSVVTKYGDHGWVLTPVEVVMNQVFQHGRKQSSLIVGDDHYRWFARKLLEGTVLEELKSFKSMLNDNPVLITRRKLVSKVVLLVSSLAENDIDSLSKLIHHWSSKDKKYLYKDVKKWVKDDRLTEFKQLWKDTIKKRTQTIVK